MKKGLRGLFNRKKSKGASQQQSDPESTSRELPTDTGAALATSARAGDDANNGPYPHYPIQPLEIQLIDPPTGPPALPAIEAPTTSSPTPAHHISEPSGVEEAKAVDLNPTPTTPTPTTTTAIDIPPTTAATTEPAEGKLLAPLTTSGMKGESSTGMSATSGPLGDHMAEVYQEVGHEHEHDPAEEDMGAGGG